MDENFLITQSNSLIEARHIKPLSITEQKIILTMVSMIQPHDEDFRCYEILVTEFKELCGLKTEGLYSNIKKTVRTLMEKIIEIPHRDGKGWFMTHWVSSAEYMAGEGMIRLNFDPRLKPYLLQLKSAFTSYRLSNILSLKSVYAIRLYELMKKWQHIAKWTISVGELRSKLGVAEGKLELYGHFKSRALKPAITEVNEKTDIYIDFKEIKRGRKVEKIEFTIMQQAEREIKLPVLQPKKPADLTRQPSDDEMLRGRINEKTVGFIFDPVAFRDIFIKSTAMWGNDIEQNLFDLLLHVNNANKIKNKIAYFRSIINEGYDRFLNGETFEAADFSTGQAHLPEWFKHPNKPVESELDSTFEEERKSLEEELRKVKTLINT
ncbi:replication initiation protein [Domibacillus mangrovi]|uniref:Initiator Rep protein WH1 domain-containing protein n=1 Tax=Domibacillus mangrovi TaxID=1714354 RepID=A0A1Q5NZF6_9BACI|nr:replication initiation protein [Domibacillus mangrovi]OKL35303.1 hypothetical protein BLL40_16275 [Domibacillus mangrovi]